MDEDKFKIEELLANPEFRKTLDAEVRAIVRERLRLRNTVQNVIMMAALVLATFALWRTPKAADDLQVAQQVLTAAQVRLDAIHDKQQKTGANIMRILGTYIETLKQLASADQRQNPGR